MAKELTFEAIVERAIVPEQLVHYVTLISPGRPKVVGPCLVYFNEDTAIVIGYPLDGDITGLTTSQLSKTLNEITRRKDLQRVIVISSIRPASAPEWGKCFQTNYWHIPLPFVPPKGRGMSSLFPDKGKAKPTVPVVRDSWSEAHADLARRFAASNNLNAGSQTMLEKLEEYLAVNPEVLLFSAYDKQDRLLGCLVGDFSSKFTAFYMLGFQEQQNLSEHNATNDSLLKALIDEAEARGKKRVFLGVAVTRKQIQEYQEKWGAQEFLPMVESAWELNESGQAQERYYYNEMARREKDQKNSLGGKLKRWFGL